MTNSFEKRIERLELHSDAQDQTGLKTIIWLSYYDKQLPDVFDRPLEQWELFKQSAGKSLLVVDPVAEARARCGETKYCPASRYNEWQDQQNGNLKPQNNNIIQNTFE